MKLILQRSQKGSGFVSKSVKFSLQAKVQLTEVEAEHVKRYKMGNEIIYSKDRMGYDPHGNDSAGGMMRNLAAIVAAITISVDDLVRGRTLHCKDIMEMMAIVDQVKMACANFKSILDAAAQFEGEEVIDY